MDRTPAYVSDMLAAAEELVQLASMLSLDQFRSDRLRCLAAEKLFINLGEAAARVDKGVAARIAGVPWEQIVATRNVLAHRYAQIEHEVLYWTIRNELPPVASALKAWLDTQAV